MPAPVDRKAQRYIDEAYLNYRRHQRALNNEEDVAWTVVYLFYAAVHLVQAHKEQFESGYVIDSHADRGLYISDNLDPIYEHYEALYRASRMARYKLRQYTHAEGRRFHDDHFAKIRKHLEALGIAWAWRTSP